MQAKLKYDQAVDKIAKYIIAMRDDPEYQRKYQKWLTEKERKQNDD